MTQVYIKGRSWGQTSVNWLPAYYLQNPILLHQGTFSVNVSVLTINGTTENRDARSTISRNRARTILKCQAGVMTLVLLFFVCLFLFIFFDEVLFSTWHSPTSLQFGVVGSVFLSEL